MNRQNRKLFESRDGSIRHGGGIKIKNITATIEQGSDIATRIAALVDPQGVATGVIAHHVEQTADATAKVTLNKAGVSEAAAKTSPAAGQVLDAAGDVSQQVAALSKEVSRFVVDIRAA